jgi:hypothetical protein
VADLIQDLAGSPQKFLASMRKDDPTRMANEKRRADFIFQIPYSPTNGRLLNVHRPRGTAKTAAIGSCNSVSEMTQINCQCSFSPNLQEIRSLSLQRIRAGENQLQAMFENYAPHLWTSLAS